MLKCLTMKRFSIMKNYCQRITKIWFLNYFIVKKVSIMKILQPLPTCKKNNVKNMNKTYLIMKNIKAMAYMHTWAQGGGLTLPLATKRRIAKTSPLATFFKIHC